MKNPLIITIGREYGSGGREIGKALAQKLGISFYDKQIISLAAEKSGLSPEFITNNEQRVRSGFMQNLAASAAYQSGFFFIHAPIEDRVRRIMALYQLSEADAMKAIATSDKERGNHYFRYTDRKWGKAQNYDLSINSSLLGIEGTVEMLADVAGIEDRVL